MTEFQLRRLAREVARLTAVELARLQVLIREETGDDGLTGVREPVPVTPPSGSAQTGPDEDDVARWET